MNELRLVDRGHDYDRLGLRANPFPAVGIPEESPTVFCNQTRALGELSKLVASTQQGRRSAHAVLVGAYGAGKSHTLRYLRDWISTELHGKMICSYVAQPGDSMKDLYAQVVKSLGFEFLRGIAEELLGLQAERRLRRRTSGIPNSRRGWAAIESGRILLSDVLPDAIREFTRDCGYPDFAKAFLNLAFEQSALTSWDWLSSDGIDYGSRKLLELRNNLKSENALAGFNALKKLLLMSGCQGLTILLDEFETIETLSNVGKQRFLNGVRHMIDTNPKGLCLIIACAPEVWQTVLSEYHAFAERISRSVMLEPLDRAGVEQLLKAYLALAVSQETDSNPFDSNVIDKIATVSGGNMRRVLALGNLCVETAASLGKNRVDVECWPDLV